VLEPRPAPRQPQLISDGSGLPFPPAALTGPPSPFDSADPAISALISYLGARGSSKRGARMPWKRQPTEAPTPEETPASLAGWRILVRRDSEVLFAHGAPDQLITVTARREGLRRGWSCAASGAAGSSLRAARDGIRASSWRLDPTLQDLTSESMLRILVTEQSFSSGQRAEGRVLPPDIYLDDDELVLTVFVTPRPGFQTGARNPETPVRVALPRPLGSRQLLDGALIQFTRPDEPPTAPRAPD
jgi:hypothetical protein